jgi:alpha,alpha-trehalase
MDKITEFIRNRWQQTVRENTKDNGSLIGLPKPYTVPCAKGKFQELYYWDTYFSCRALVKQGFIEQAKNNCDNFIYEINTIGFIPNGNRTYYLNRSQPPYFAALVELVFQYTDDKEWLQLAVDALEKEYKFWLERRSFKNGLFHYGHHAENNDIPLEMYASCGLNRIGLSPVDSIEEQIEIANHIVAEAESGWDFNPRFDCRCQDFAPVDLNSLIYQMQMLLSKFYDILDDKLNSQEWQTSADTFKVLINKYLWNSKKGAFMDFDVKNSCFSSIVSAASFQPLWVELATKQQAKTTLKLSEQVLEFDFGISTCEKNQNSYVFQWDFPNAWPPLQIIAMDACLKYDFNDAAERIANKYINSVRKSFDATGDIWEKYNVLDGSIDVKDEYEMPAMMGWSAAAYIVALDILK